MPKNRQHYRKIKYPDKVTKQKRLVFVRIFLFSSVGSRNAYFPTAPSSFFPSFIQSPGIYIIIVPPFFALHTPKYHYVSYVDYPKVSKNLFLLLILIQPLSVTYIVCIPPCFQISHQANRLHFELYMSCIENNNLLAKQLYACLNKVTTTLPQLHSAYPIQVR